MDYFRADLYNNERSWKTEKLQNDCQKMMVEFLNDISELSEYLQNLFKNLFQNFFQNLFQNFFQNLFQNLFQNFLQKYSTIFEKNCSRLGDFLIIFMIKTAKKTFIAAYQLKGPVLKNKIVKKTAPGYQNYKKLPKMAPR